MYTNKKKGKWPTKQTPRGLRTSSSPVHCFSCSGFLAGHSARMIHDDMEKARSFLQKKRKICANSNDFWGQITFQGAALVECRWQQPRHVISRALPLQCLQEIYSINLTNCFQIMLLHCDLGICNVYLHQLKLCTDVLRTEPVQYNCNKTRFCVWCWWNVRNHTVHQTELLQFVHKAGRTFAVCQITRLPSFCSQLVLSPSCPGTWNHSGWPHT